MLRGLAVAWIQDLWAQMCQTFFNEKMNHPVIQEVQKMRELLLSYGENKEVVLDVDSTVWFNKMTEKNKR